MLVALYIGNHQADTLSVRLGWWLTRLAQKGAYGHVTHCEAILQRRPDGAVLIASSSMRDGGVRIKQNVQLNPAHWLIADVPQWDDGDAMAWFLEHAGQPYDWRGALATVLPGKERAGQWFCDGSLLASVGFKTPECFTPAHFAAICFSLGRDVTAQFFAGGAR